MGSHGDVSMEISWECHGRISPTICHNVFLDEFDRDLRSWRSSGMMVY